MNESELVISLAQFAGHVRTEVKGLSAHVVWNLFGSDADYVLGSDETEGVEIYHGMRRLPKTRVDWETYVLLYGAGALQGHTSGFAEHRPGGGYSGRLEEKKDTQYIHQLLGNNCSTLKARCGLTYSALGARVSLMVAEPHRTAAILFFQEYLRSIYRGVSGADAEILIEHLKTLPGMMEPEELLGKWREIEVKLKSERRPALYEVKDGKFFVFEKVGKGKRLVNGWLFGIEEPVAAAAAPDSLGWSADFENRLATAAFFMRMKIIQSEAAYLLHDENEEALEMASEARSGRLAKILASVDRFAELADANMLKDEQKPIAKMLIDTMDRIVLIVAKRARVLSAIGIDTTAIRDRHVLTQKLKRKI